MRVTSTQVHTAYRKLKSLVYYDKTDLHLRARLAEFECDKNFGKRLDEVRDVLNTESPASHRKFKRWLNAINYRLVPKKLKPSPQERAIEMAEQGRFITNVTTTPAIEVDKVNYFFDGPIELHLIAVLWLMTDGYRLDADLVPESCGSRLSGNLQDDDDESLALFKKYHEQYARWRDSGIRKAKQLLVDERKSVAILGLDIQEFYYRVAIDFEEVAQALSNIQEETLDCEDHPNFLLECVQAIGVAYRRCIDPLLSQTHSDIGEEVIGLPIGLCSSVVLANWYLHKFDVEILRRVRPAYYGRYVDDILLVVPISHDPSENTDDPVSSFMDELMVRTGMIRSLPSNVYELNLRPGLLLQQKKCILQYFDAKHSIAGLEKFQKKLEENGSDFLLLPVDEADNSMEDVAYELLYEGSVNKFRSVKGVAENRYELAKHLARQTILHLLTDDPPDRKVSQGLQKFFKGRSAIEFFDLWERVFTLLGISEDSKTYKAFEKQLQKEIARVQTDQTDATNRLRENLTKHLKLSLAMAEAVCEADIGLSDLIDEVHSERFKRANLLRHHFVRRPLLNFTTYSGPLNTRTTKEQVKLDPHKLKFSPRFVNFDECMLLASGGCVDVKHKTPFEFASMVFNKVNRHDIAGVSWTQVQESQE